MVLKISADDNMTRAAEHISCIHNGIMPKSAKTKTKAAKPTQRPTPGFTWEIKNNDCVILPPDFLEDIKSRKIQNMPMEWFKKTAAIRGFFDDTIVAEDGKSRVLSCMSVTNDNVVKWRSFVISRGFGTEFISAMRVVVDQKMVEMAREVDLRMNDGTHPRTFKEVGESFFSTSSKELEAQPNGRDRLCAKYFHVLGSPFAVRSDDFITKGVEEYFKQRQMMVSLGTKPAGKGKKMTVHSIVAYGKDRATRSNKETIRQKFIREKGYIMQLNREVEKSGQMPVGGNYAIVDITPYVDPVILGRSRRHSGGRFYVKLGRDVDGRAVFHKQASEMITAGVANGLGKEQVRTIFNAAYFFVFDEQCLMDGGLNVGVGKSSEDESAKIAEALAGSVGGNTLPSISIGTDEAEPREDGASESRDELS